MAFRYNVPVEDIRAQNITFQALVLASFNRLHELIPEVIKAREKGSWRDWMAIEASVRCLDAFLGPYYDNNYELEVKKLLPRITLQKAQSHDWDYVVALMAWIKLIVARFGNVDVLPHIAIRHVFVNPIDFEKEGLEQYEENTALDKG